jgi:hypothetical protein
MKINLRHSLLVLSFIFGYSLFAKTSTSKLPADTFPTKATEEEKLKLQQEMQSADFWWPGKYDTWEEMVQGCSSMSSTVQEQVSRGSNSPLYAPNSTESAKICNRVFQISGLNTDETLPTPRREYSEYTANPTH